MRMIDNGDVEGLRSFATEDVSMVEMRIRSSAMQVAARAMRAQVDKLATLYDAAVNSGKMSLHEQAVLREMFHKQVQLSMEVQALDTNLGSAAGALLGQRARQMDIMSELKEAIKEAEEAAKQAGKSDKQARKAAREARRAKERELKAKFKSEASEGNSGWLLSEYKKLTNDLKVDPRLAYERVKNIAREAESRGVALNPKSVQKMKDREKRLEKAAEEETGPQKFFRGLEQWRYNAMLSGWKTHETNILSTLARTTSNLVYQGVFGDKATRIAATRKAAGMITGMRQSMGYAVQAYKEMKPVLDQLSMFERLDPVYRNHLLTYPVRLMLGVDEFIKQLTYRGEVFASAAIDADLAGLSGQARTDYINDRMNLAYDENGAGLDTLAVDMAQANAFQKEYRGDSRYVGERFMAKMTQLTSDNAFARFLFPFMRIFFRLTDEGIRMTPGVREGIALGTRLGNAARGRKGGSKFYDDLMGTNGKIEQARAYGEFATGLSIVAWTMSMVAEGNITGGEEVNYVDAQMRRRTVPPYSIRIGDEWYSYERFEPFSFPMKFYANMLIRMKKAENSRDRGEWEGEDRIMQESIGAFAYSMSEAVTNNSFMEGLESLAKLTGGSVDDGEAWKRPVHTMADSYVPNILRKINASFDDTGNKYRADPLTMDAFKRHFSSVLDMDEVDVKRNPFTGEPIVYDDFDDAAGHTNFIGVPVRNDKAMALLIEANENTGKQFVLKRPTAFIPTIDLRDIPQDGGGRSLYDQFQEVFSTIKDDNGMTYRDHLERLADDPEFSKIPWGNSTRVPGMKAEVIEKIKRDYQQRAERWMEKNSKSYAFLYGEQARYERNQERDEVREFFAPN